MPQNQRTEASPFSDLPELTPQQHEFACLLGMRKVKSAAEAYRQAYDCSGSGPKTIWVEASRLRLNPAVSLWIEAYRMATVNNEVCSHEEHLTMLAELRDESRAKGNLGAAVNAEVSRGKAAGLYIEQVKDVTGQFDPVSTLKQIAEHSPELAASLAAQHGIVWTVEGETRH